MQELFNQASYGVSQTTFSFGNNRIIGNALVMHNALGKKAIIHQVTIMLATSKNVLFPGHNHLLTTGANDPTL